MNQERLIRNLEFEWETEHGFFWQLRQGAFSEEDFQRAFGRISSIPDFENSMIDRRVVSLLWYVPLFMQWQSDRILVNGGNAEAYRKAVTAMTNEVERLLGVP